VFLLCFLPSFHRREFIAHRPIIQVFTVFPPNYVRVGKNLGIDDLSLTMLIDPSIDVYNIRLFSNTVEHTVYIVLGHKSSSVW